MGLAPVRITHKFPKDSDPNDVRAFAEDKRGDPDVSRVEESRDPNTQEYIVVVTRAGA